MKSKLYKIIKKEWFALMSMYVYARPVREEA